jgi:hypothetical protein
MSNTSEKKILLVHRCQATISNHHSLVWEDPDGDDSEDKKRRLVAIFILIRDIPNGRSSALRHTAGKKDISEPDSSFPFNHPARNPRLTFVATRSFLAKVPFSNVHRSHDTRQSAGKS